MDPIARMHADLDAFLRWASIAAPSSRPLEVQGVTGAIVPATPDRSVFNSLVYDDAGALERALPDIAAAYDEAGIHAWTVWVDPGDERARELLARAGHTLDAGPLAMVCELEGFEPPPLGDLEWTEDPDLLADVMAVNDGAYPFEGTPWSDVFTTVADGVHVYLARLDGETASGAVTFEQDGSAGVYGVATLPHARGRGLSWRLLGRALADARDRGCTHSTLQATKMGVPVYERLGYRSYGAIEMWERRRPGN